MLSKKLHDALNEQMNFEFYSAHAYMAMVATVQLRAMMDSLTFSLYKLKKNVSTQ